MTASFYWPKGVRVELLNVDPSQTHDIAIAIPARNEEERIGACLEAIAGQSEINRCRVKVVIALNNTTDHSLDVVRSVASKRDIAVEVLDYTVSKIYANAGFARRVAMDRARQSVPSDGVILSTDADTRPDADWVSQNLRELGRGVDAVAGYVTAEPGELALLNADVLDLGAVEWKYQNLLAELDGRVDAIDYDPWPKHNQHCGASMAVRASAYSLAGGLPVIPVGEDRALFEAITRTGGRVRHALSAHVVTSARTVGRACGGMADALRTRGTQAYMCDEVLEPAFDALRRARWRADARRAHQSGAITIWCCQQHVPSDIAAGAGHVPFGHFWQLVENEHPSLSRMRLRSDQLTGEIQRTEIFISLIS